MVDNIAHRFVAATTLVAGALGGPLQGDADPKLSSDCRNEP